MSFLSICWLIFFSLTHRTLRRLEAHSCMPSCSSLCWKFLFLVYKRLPCFFELPLRNSSFWVRFCLFFFFPFQMFRIIQKEVWYKPDVFTYKDLIIALAKSKRMEEVMQVWESMRKEELFPDSQTYAEVIRGFLRHGSPADAMNVYEDMKKSPDPPKELPFRILLKGLLPHPLLRNKVKQDFEELFPERNIYDPPAEIFGMSWGMFVVYFLEFCAHAQSNSF